MYRFYFFDNSLCLRSLSIKTRSRGVWGPFSPQICSLLLSRNLAITIFNGLVVGIDVRDSGPTVAIRVPLVAEPAEESKTSSVVTMELRLMT